MIIHATTTRTPEAARTLEALQYVGRDDGESEDLAGGSDGAVMVR